MTPIDHHEPFDLELLSGYVDDELSSEERALVEKRLASDPDARGLVDELRALSKSMRDMPPVELSADIRRRVLECISSQQTDGRDEQRRQRSTLAGAFGEGRGVRRGLAWATAAIAATIALAVMLPPAENREGGQLAQSEKPPALKAEQSPSKRQPAADREQPAFRATEPSGPPAIARDGAPSTFDAVDELAERPSAERGSRSLRIAPSAEPGASAEREDQPSGVEADRVNAAPGSEEGVADRRATPLADQMELASPESAGGAEALSSRSLPKQAGAEAPAPPAQGGLASDDRRYGGRSTQPAAEVADSHFGNKRMNQIEQEVRQIDVVRLSVDDRRQAAERFEQFLASNDVRWQPPSRLPAADADLEQRVVETGRSATNLAEAVLVEATPAQLAQILAACRTDDAFRRVEIGRNGVAPRGDATLQGDVIDRFRPEQQEGQVALGAVPVDSQAASRYYFSNDASGIGVADQATAAASDGESWAMPLTRVPAISGDERPRSALAGSPAVSSRRVAASSQSAGNSAPPPPTPQFRPPSADRNTPNRVRMLFEFTETGNEDAPPDRAEPTPK